MPQDTLSESPTPAEWAAAGARVEYHGHSIFYRDEGAPSAAMLLIHGFPTASWDWHRVWPALRERFRLIAPDLIGFGFSDKPSRYAYSTHDQADLVEHLLERLAPGPVHVLAHDYGDTVAQELLARMNERGDGTPRLASVCFLNGGLFPETLRPLLIQHLLLTPLGGLLTRLYTRRMFARSFRSIFGPATLPSDAEIEHYWSLMQAGGGRRMLHRLMRYMPERKRYRARWVEALQQAQVPLRLIDGAVDPISGAHMVQRYRELVPDADVVLLDGIGHYPQMEAPDDVVREVLAFLLRTPERA